MDENVKIILVDDNNRLNKSMFILDNKNSKIGSFDKDVVIKFREKIKLLISHGKMIVIKLGNKMFDGVSDFYVKYEDAFDDFVSMVSDGYDVVMEKMEQLKKDDVSSFSKLKPMLFDEKMNEIGDFVDDSIVGMREFRLEDYDEINVKKGRR